MSGPSTLRLCFAAMAPALTEAASARLKLQDSGSKHGDTRTVHGDCNISIPKADRLTSPRKNGDHEPFPLCDLKTDGDRVDLTNGTHGDTVRSPPKGKGGGLNLTSGVSTSVKNKNNSTSINIGHLTSLTVNGKQLSSFIDGRGEDSETNGFLVGLKRMNQPYFTAANANKDQSVEGGKSHFNSSDTLRILASKVVSQTGMVNGDSGNDRQKEEEPVKKSCVRESGDAQVTQVSVKSGGESKNSKLPEQKKGPLKFVLPVDTDNKGNNKIMGMCEKDKIALSAKLEKQLESSLVAKNSEMEKPCEEVRKECVKKQAYLERKVEMLMRRLKRVKGKVVETHTKEQLVQYVNFQHRNLQMVAKSIKSEAPCPEMLKEHFLSNEDVKNMSTSQLVKLVRDHQSNKSLPITDNSRYRLMNTSASVMPPGLQAQSFSASEKLSFRVEAVEKDLDSDATASSSGGESCDEESIPCPPRDTALPSICKRAEWKWAVDRAAIVARWTWLQAQVSDLEYKIRQQSQVHRQLRNSKGGVVLGDPPTAVDILRKLQGFKQIDSSTSNCATATSEEKGSAVPEGSSSTEVSPYNITRLLSNVDKQASRLTQTLNCISPSSSTVGSPGAAIKTLSPFVSRGVVDSPSSSSLGSEITDTTADNSPLVTAPSSSSSLSNLSQQQSVPEFPSLHHSSHLSSSTSSISDASFQAARCRPLRSYRKRKILRTIGLYKTSVKAARLSDIRCRCYPPSSPCAMCGGRYNNTLSMDADNMSFNERVALLDASFHPVLSFPQDIPLSVHCEGFLKSGLWQNKPHSKRSKAGDYRRQKVLSFAVPDSVAVKKSQTSINNSNNKSANGRASSSTPSVINFTAKIKNKYEGKTKTKKNGAMARAAPLKHKANKVKKKAAKLSKVMKKRKERDEEDKNLESLYLDQEASCSSSTSREDRLSNSASGSQTPSQRRRRTDNAFDINNIEIPHSIAASTRVEQIQYKEIVTPKWRVVENEADSPGLSEEDSSGSSTASGLAVPSVLIPHVDPLVTVTAGKMLEKTNGLSLSLEQHHEKAAVPTRSDTEEQEEVEDLSDEAYLQRHHQPEQEERKRFRTFLQYPPVGRRHRARSDALINNLTNNNNVDITNNNLPVTNTATNSERDGDASGDVESEEGESGGNSSLLSRSLPSLPLAQSNSEDIPDQQQSSGRRRSVLLASGSRRERTSSSGLGDSYSVGNRRLLSSSTPWPRREFPLQEDEYTRMQSESSSSSSNCEPLHQEIDQRLATEPSGKVYVDSGRSGSIDNPDEGCTSVVSSGQGSRAPSPHPSNESASSVGDDPTDPDWMTSAVDPASGKGTGSAVRYRHTSHTNPAVADPDWTMGSDNPKKGKKR